jgi:hypothetical protein
MKRRAATSLLRAALRRTPAAHSSTGAAAHPPPTHRDPPATPSHRTPATPPCPPAGLQPQPRQQQAAGGAAARALFHTSQLRASGQPEHVVYSGPSAPSPRRVTLRTLRQRYEAGQQISMVTAYDYPSAVHVRAAGPRRRPHRQQAGRAGARGAPGRRQPPLQPLPAQLLRSPLARLADCPPPPNGPPAATTATAGGPGADRHPAGGRQRGHGGPRPRHHAAHHAGRHAAALQGGRPGGQARLPGGRPALRLLRDLQQGRSAGGRGGGGRGGWQPGA